MTDNTELTVGAEALDRLMPLHLAVAPSGHIRHAGPAVARLLSDGPEVTELTGRRFLEIFELRRPRNISRVADLVCDGGARLSMVLRGGPDIQIKALAMPAADGGLLINMSFGIFTMKAVAAFGLNGGDFAHTDLATEMLYLVEANSGVEQEAKRLIMHLESARMVAEEQSFTDTLTGLKNRRAMDAVMGQHTFRGGAFGLMHLDLDYFKAVNDTLGHAAGDHVLQETARILTAETRQEDVVIRFGGDEFVLLFPGLTDPERLGRVAQRILDRLEQPIMYQDQACRISGSIGITISSDYEDPDAEQMLIDADTALYASKKAGRAQHTFVRDVGGVGQSAADLAAAQGQRH